ncbi:hypothetical protein INT43_001801 [Umbelopsis isabellina]|uniref:Phospholipid/glycerol acyltransferase domain-containing protein n=1 Tax=Mortierella isabellina TaxID=91625 RepID=A0A8H7PSY0_MORIS|nr:hypothetical protein INT43_001801 [Umbelopsis isabellina]
MSTTKLPSTSHTGQDFQSALAYEFVKNSFKVITTIFFREIRTSGVHQVPTDKPCIFIVAPHANQFVDPGMVMITSPVQFSPLMAASQFKRHIIGTAARLLNAIPVIRPQDLASAGAGSVRLSSDRLDILEGIDTKFKEQVHPRDLISINKTLKVQVEEVMSDSRARLATPVTEADASVLRKDEGVKYKVVPHVNQHDLFDKVHDSLGQSRSIVIFPEGGSHDRPELLPLKVGFALMALGAMAKYPDLDLKIVPVGLNYFHPHRFRSRAVVSYGAPISIDRKLVEDFKHGGDEKREATSKLLNLGREGLKSVTVNAPDYDALLVIQAARRLYRPANRKLRLEQVVELNRRFLIGWTQFKDDPRVIELARKIRAYNQTLKYFGLRDHQVEKTSTATLNAAKTLLIRIFELALLASIGLPATILNSPIILLAIYISQIKQKEALANSSVKIAARDVLATWKILVAIVFAPLLFLFYSVVLTYVVNIRYPNLNVGYLILITLAAWIIQPIVYFSILRLTENGIDIYKSLGPVFLAVSDPDAAKGLRIMREKLSEAITSFVDEAGPQALEDFDPTRFEREATNDDSSSTSSKSNSGFGLLSGANWLDDKWLFQAIGGDSDESD